MTRRRGEIPFLLAMTYRAMTEALHERIAAEGREPLRPAHGYTFRLLLDRGGATSVELAEHLGVTKQAASKIVAELEDWGYVERRPHATDGRARVLALTDKGRAYVRHADDMWADIEDRWGEVIGAERLDRIHEDLRAYVDEVAGGRAVLRPIW
ncbi:MarR family winged helix-turn-helix transcriptional regulator [Planomonospora venezuelensis]|uniref:DNA-binding MarR family transcriptional regulator n=1 Tax=Planomonospora venezuelensis TaxID=1999 RepID=A0A841CQX0_PLAVE|nr:MarR family transcriptional regulator [Planomonospora venezuelensis]MBB5960822.1 DNA-binding MarR family transcriptional regulator [Planomonospora venezuelensis]GIN03783.1 MarR family transcriptional regulator [Planomonospora venezuelensis]